MEVFRPSDIMEPNELLQYLASVNEMGDRMRQEVTKPNLINLSMQTLSKSSSHAIFPSIALCKTLEELILYGCGIDDEMITDLWNSLQSATISVNYIK